jgi:hypothetical protein
MTAEPCRGLARRRDARALVGIELRSSVSMRVIERSSLPTTERITEPSERSIAEASSAEPCWPESEVNLRCVPPPTWSRLPSAIAISARAGSSVESESPAEIGRLRRASTEPLASETTVTCPSTSRTYE